MFLPQRQRPSFTSIQNNGHVGDGDINKKGSIAVVSDGNRDKYKMECNDRIKTRRHCALLREDSTKIFLTRLTAQFGFSLGSVHTDFWNCGRIRQLLLRNPPNLIVDLELTSTTCRSDMCMTWMLTQGWFLYLDETLLNLRWLLNTREKSLLQFTKATSITWTSSAWN